LDTAREEARFEREIEIAKEMLNDNEPLQKIVKFTGLTIEQIEKIIKGNLLT